MPPWKNTVIFDADKPIRPIVTVCALVHNMKERQPNKDFIGPEIVIGSVFNERFMFLDVIDERHLYFPPSEADNVTTALIVAV